MLLHDQDALQDVLEIRHLGFCWSQAEGDAVVAGVDKGVLLGKAKGVGVVEGLKLDKMGGLSKSDRWYVSLIYD